MSCYFCKKSTHLSEYCRGFPTLRSRYSEVIKRGQSNCLCQKYDPISTDNSMCKCKIICEVCFQHHHIAICPKRDHEHPSNPIIFPEPLSLLSHHSPFAIRFFELCNPIDKFKLQNCCHFFKSLQPISLKLKPDFFAEKLPQLRNVVLNRFGKFFDAKNIKASMSEKNLYFNFDSLSLEKCDLTKAELKLFAASDPHTVFIKRCTVEHQYSLHDFLEEFPYAYDITYITEETPENWILSFLCVERKVNLQKITVTDKFLDFEIDDFVMLLEQNEELILTVLTESTLKTTTREQLQTHPQFIGVEPEAPHNLCIFLELSGIKHCFRFHRF